MAYTDKDDNNVESEFNKKYSEIQASDSADIFHFKCTECGHEFRYVRAYLDKLDPGYKYKDDWMIECPKCNNWEQVGNNKPSYFEVL